MTYIIPKLIPMPFLVSSTNDDLISQRRTYQKIPKTSASQLYQQLQETAPINLEFVPIDEQIQVQNLEKITTPDTALPNILFTLNHLDPSDPELYTKEKDQIRSLFFESLITPERTGEINFQSPLAHIETNDDIQEKEEDRSHSIGISIGLTPIQIAMIADGHGGSEAAEFAKQNLHIQIEAQLNPLLSISESESLEELSKLVTIKEFDQIISASLKRAIIQLDHLLQKSDIKNGCTLIFSTSIGNRTYITNLGDSNAVLVDTSKEDYPMVILSEPHNACHDDLGPSHSCQAATNRGLKYIIRGGNKDQYLCGGYLLHPHISASIQPSSGLGDQKFNGYMGKIPAITIIQTNNPNWVLFLGSDGSIMTDADTSFDVAKQLNNPKSKISLLKTKLSLHFEASLFLQLQAYAPYGKGSLLKTNVASLWSAFKRHGSRCSAQQAAIESKQIFHKIFNSHDDGSVTRIQFQAPK